MQLHNPDEDSFDRPIRHIRPERRRKGEIVSEDQSWAVSYSDILMVLMSFFVLFFSIDEEKKSDILTRIAVEIGNKNSVSDPVLVEQQPLLKTPAVPQPAPQIVTSSKQESQNISGSSDVQNRMERLAKKFEQNKLKASIGSDRKFLVVDLSDNIFELGKFEVNGSTKQYLKRIIKSFGSEIPSLRLTFIGYTDSSRLSKRGKYLANNTDLSALRASRAMEYVGSLGFLDSQMSSQSMQSQHRNTRSISVKIEPSDQ